MSLLVHRWMSANQKKGSGGISTLTGRPSNSFIPDKIEKKSVSPYSHVTVGSAVVIIVLRPVLGEILGTVVFGIGYRAKCIGIRVLCRDCCGKQSHQQYQHPWGWIFHGILSKLNQCKGMQVPWGTPIMVVYGCNADVKP